MAVSANRLELLQIADAVAREKVIDKQIVLDAMADAIAKAARSRYGAETDIHATIDPKTGELRLSRHLLVVDDGALENEQALIAPGEDPGAVDRTDDEPQAGKAQPERKQDEDLDTGEENPG